MTGMERLRAAAEGRALDRVPVFCNLLDQGARELGMSLKAYYSKGEHVAEGQLRLRGKYGYDNLWSLFYVGKEAELLGCRRIEFAEDGPPLVGDMVIKSLGDIERLEVPRDLSSHPGFAEELACLRLLKAESAGRWPICAYLTASMTLPSILMGIERWMELLLRGPIELRDALLEKCSLFFQAEAAAYRAAGADILLYSNPFGSTDIVPRRVFTELSLPWMERDLARGGTSGIVYYCGGAAFNDVIEEVFGRLGIGAYYLSPFDDVAEGKRAIGGRGLACGVINDIRLISWSPAEIRAEVRRIMEAGKPGGRFLFGTLVMPLAIPEPNIRALVDAALEFGAMGDT